MPDLATLRQAAVSHLWGALNLAVLRPFFSSPFLVRRLFSLEVPAGMDSIFLFDATTLCLAASLRRLRFNPRRALDMGTGELALVAQLVQRRFGCPVDALELKERGVRLSRRSCAVNRSAVRVRRSDLFAAAEGEYDLITFNPPYVPARMEAGARRYLDAAGILGPRYDRGVDCGPDGALTVVRFLEQAPPQLSADGRILLGFNTRLLAWPVFLSHLERSGLEAIDVDRYLGGIWRIAHLSHKRRS